MVFQGDEQRCDVVVPSPQQPPWETTMKNSATDTSKPETESVQTFPAIPPEKAVSRDLQASTPTPSSSRVSDTKGGLPPESLSLGLRSQCLWLRGIRCLIEVTQERSSTDEAYLSIESIPEVSRRHVTPTLSGTPTDSFKSDPLVFLTCALMSW